jgi:hypothetical protein
MIAECDIFTPVKGPNGRWCYGFDTMEVGDIMHCPYNDGESMARGGSRVSSAAVCWRSLDPERAGIKFRTRRRKDYIVIERIE